MEAPERTAEIFEHVPQAFPLPQCFEWLWEREHSVARGDRDCRAADTDSRSTIEQPHHPATERTDARAPAIANGNCAADRINAVKRTSTAPSSSVTSWRSNT